MEFVPVNTYQQNEKPPTQFPWRIVIIVGLVLTVAIVAFLLLRSRGGEGPLFPRNDDMQDAMTACDGEECEFGEVLAIVVNSRDVSLCRSKSINVEGFDTQECISQYALEYSDPSACDQLSGESKDICASLVYRQMADESSDAALCNSIPDEDSRNTCLVGFVYEYADSGQCNLLAGNYRESCDTLIAERYDVARRIGAGLCDDFSTEPQGEESESLDYQTCLSVIDTLDLDGDGLVIRQEIELGTDNENPDTDGDGFDDGTEVRSGYNPLGE